MFKTYAGYLKTKRELDRLTDRELRDIGINRYEIESIAKGLAEKKVTDAGLLDTILGFFKGDVRRPVTQ